MPPGQGHASAGLRRFLGLFGLWFVLGGGMAPADLAVGAAAAAYAAHLSLRLLPPSGHALRPIAALRLAVAVLRASLGAGIDIARRAFDPRLPIRPGTVILPLGLPPGPARDGFRLLSSLQPGTVPAGLDRDGALAVHALDTRLPVERETRAAEALFAAAAGREAPHG
jgi:multicomponent Na+:H+ antiporter subunit E